MFSNVGHRARRKRSKYPNERYETFRCSPPLWNFDQTKYLSRSYFDGRKSARKNERVKCACKGFSKKITPFEPLDIGVARGHYKIEKIIRATVLTDVIPAQNVLLSLSPEIRPNTCRGRNGNDQRSGPLERDARLRVYIYVCVIIVTLCRWYISRDVLLFLRNERISAQNQLRDRPNG